MKKNILSLKKIKLLFNTSELSIKKNCLSEIKKYRLQYSYLSSCEREKVYQSSLTKINQDKQKIAKPYRKKIWYSGWKENFEEFKNTRKNIALVPKYYVRKKTNIFRLGGKFIKVSDQKFEIKILDIYRNWFFKEYFSQVESIYEFGAGSGNNIISAAKIFPKKKIYGLDFVKSSVSLMNLIRKRYYNVSGSYFDMSKKNKKFKIDNNAGFLSIGSLEQLNNNLDNIINFFLYKKPSICLNIEPDLFFYKKKSSIEDKIGLKFQKKRGYSSTLFKKLFNLQKKNKIKIIKYFRAPFGSQFIEGYNFILWKII